MADKIKSVVIVGGGTAGWMAAALLSRTLGSDVKIQLIESDEISTVGVGEATIPPIKLFNMMLDVNEEDFLRHTQGTFKLGIQFRDWGSLGGAYMHAFGGLGIDFGMINFYQYWLKSLHEGGQYSLWDFSPNYIAAMQNKFGKLDSIGSTRMEGLDYAYHFDATLFARYLRGYCGQYGVIRTEGKVVDVCLHPDNGFIQSVVLENGSEISGDFFIDCSGFNGVLIEGALKTGYEDWSDFLPCDRAIAVSSKSSGPILPYTISSAQKSGWQWQIPLRNRIGNGHVYSSRYMSDDEAAVTLLRNLTGEPIAEPRQLSFKTGRRKKIWNKNCVALGLSSGFLEPLESTSIHLIQFVLSKLIDVFPKNEFVAENTDKFNNDIAKYHEHIRDFIILHYHLTQRDDSAFWLHCRHMDVPQGVSKKIALFKKTGYLHRDSGDLFAQPGWLQVMIGQGNIPDTYHPFADKLSPEKNSEHLLYLKESIRVSVAKLPSYERYLIGCLGI